MLDGGRERILRDNGTSCEYSSCAIHSLVGYSPAYRNFLVLQGLYESWEYLLVDRRTGHHDTCP